MTNKIKHYRTIKNLTQKELANKSNVSERSLQALENGESEPKLSTAMRIAKVLNTTVEKLFTL